MPHGRISSRHRLAAMLILIVATSLVWQVTARALLPKAAADRVNSPPLNVTCDRSGCHTPPVGPNQGSVEVLGVPSCYVPGEKYVLTVKVSDPNASRWGFEIGVQYNEGNAFDTTSAGILDNLAGQPTTGVSSPDGARNFVTHNQNSGDIDGTYPGQTGSASWNVTWTAPDVRTTPVCIYVAGVAANNNDGRSGDRTYNGKICIEACGATRGTRSTWGQVKRRYGR